MGLAGNFGPWELFLILWILFSVFLYMLPTYIAIKKQKNNALQVFLINVFLGFTLIGWFVALVLALQNDPSIGVMNEENNLGK